MTDAPAIVCIGISIIVTGIGCTWYLGRLVGDLKAAIVAIAKDVEHNSKRLDKIENEN